jgi:hypothetical protein
MDLECRDCKFFDSEEYENEEVTYEMTYGSCRRYPPKRIDGNTSGFPIVEDDWWCGEFMKKEEA